MTGVPDPGVSAAMDPIVSMIFPENCLLMLGRGWWKIVSLCFDGSKKEREVAQDRLGRGCTVATLRRSVRVGVGWGLSWVGTRIDASRTPVSVCTFVRR